MPKNSCFVTGTDTEIGKTVVAAALIRALARRGGRIAGMKPVASGSVAGSQGLRNEDALALMRASGVQADYGVVNPYAFEPAIAPHIAAAEAGVSIDFDRITDCYSLLAADADGVVVEGVGGWFAPLNGNRSVADLAATLDLPVVLVVGMRLGCLNHAQLTAESIRHAGVECAGWVANDLDGSMARLEENVQALRERLPFPMIARLPSLSQPAEANIEFAIAE